MARPRTDISDTQLSVLQVLWDRGPQTIRQITDVLYPDGSAAYYATVQKLLDRLEEKHFVKRDRRGPRGHRRCVDRVFPQRASPRQGVSYEPNLRPRGLRRLWRGVSR